MRTSVRFNKRAFTLVELMIVVAIIGILAVLAIYGMSKYVKNSKTAEARNSLGKNAMTAFSNESLAPGAALSVGGATAMTRRECLSATASVPATMAPVQGG